MHFLDGRELSLTLLPVLAVVGEGERKLRD